MNEELKEAIEYFNKALSEADTNNEIEFINFKKKIIVLLKLAESVLKVGSDLPKKFEGNEFCLAPAFRQHECPDEGDLKIWTYGYNSALDKCNLVIAKSYIRKDSLPSYQQIKEVSAQGYCTKRNENKELDGDLLEDVSYVIHKLITGE